VAPALALIAMVWAGVANYATLLGVPPGAVETWALPGAFAVAAVIGIAYGVWLRSARPEVYRGIGLGLETAPAPERPAPSASGPSRRTPDPDRTPCREPAPRVRYP
jgi:hypothetical protein